MIHTVILSTVIQRHTWVYEALGLRGREAEPEYMADPQSVEVRFRTGCFGSWEKRALKAAKATSDLIAICNI